MSEMRRRTSSMSLSLKPTPDCACRLCSIVCMRSQRCSDMGAYDSFSGSHATVALRAMYLSLVRPISSACSGGLYVTVFCTLRRYVLPLPPPAVTTACLWMASGTWQRECGVKKGHGWGSPRSQHTVPGF